MAFLLAVYENWCHVFILPLWFLILSFPFVFVISCFAGHIVPYPRRQAESVCILSGRNFDISWGAGVSLRYIPSSWRDRQRTTVAVQCQSAAVVSRQLTPRHMLSRSHCSRVSGPSCFMTGIYPGLCLGKEFCAICWSSFARPHIPFAARSGKNMNRSLFA